MNDSFGLATSQARTRASLVLVASREQVAGAAGRISSHVSRYKLVELSPNRVVLTARMNWRTWGLRITLFLTEDASGHTTIDALCEPRVGTTLVDYGQGKKDLRRILDFIRQESKSSTPSV
jgi:hypothetical protein